MSPTTREGGRRAPSRVARLFRSRTTQGFLFTAPLLALFAAFVIYPMAFGVWYALDADSYRALFSDPTFRQTVVNTLRSEEHTSELQSQSNLVCRLLLEKKKNRPKSVITLRI